MQLDLCLHTWHLQLLLGEVVGRLLNDMQFFVSGSWDIAISAAPWGKEKQLVSIHK